MRARVAGFMLTETRSLHSAVARRGYAKPAPTREYADVGETRRQRRCGRRRRRQHQNPSASAKRPLCTRSTFGGAAYAGGAARGTGTGLCAVQVGGDARGLHGL